MERAGDNAGAIIGPLLASALVGTLGVRHTILPAFIPGILAAVAITIAAREARRTLTVQRSRTTLKLNLGELRRANIGRTLTPVALFEFGNITSTLLILRAHRPAHHLDAHADSGDRDRHPAVHGTQCCRHGGGSGRRATG